MRYLVRARVKPGKEADLLQAIEEGTLGQGSIAGDEYLRNMAQARLIPGRPEFLWPGGGPAVFQSKAFVTKLADFGRLWESRLQPVDQIQDKRPVQRGVLQVIAPKQRENQNV